MFYFPNHKVGTREAVDEGEEFERSKDWGSSSNAYMLYQFRNVWKMKGLENDRLKVPKTISILK